MMMVMVVVIPVRVYFWSAGGRLPEYKPWGIS